MSFETFPCGSPEAVSPEEPAPSLYVEHSDEDPSRLLIKKPVETEPSRLAETANIEDKIMNEDEIAQVNASGGERLRISTQSVDGRSRKNGDDSTRRVEGHHFFDKIDIARAHWIQLNYGNATTSPAHASLLKEKQDSLPSSKKFESGDRASVIIKRSKEQEEIESDSDSESQDTSKINTNDSLRCNENISGVEGCEENVSSWQGHSRAIYYNYNVNHEEVRKLQDKGNAKLVRGVPGEAKAVPIYYMPAGYSHMLAMPGASSTGNTNMLQRDHLHANAKEVKRFQQHLDYVSGRPEQQVPVASNVNPSEGFGNFQHGSAAAGIHYADRRLVHGGYAMVPGIGPVFYQGLPMGGDQSHYENYTSLQQQFVPISNIPAESTSSQPQTQLTSSSAASSDHLNQRNQEKMLNASKPYASPVHHTAAVSPASSLEEKRLANSPALKSESGSPAPVSAEDIDGKRSVQAKFKARPKPTSGASKPEIKCEQCGKTFGSSSALAKHKLTHSDERKYVCVTCGKGFKRQDHLNGHMVTHRDKKPYECNFTDCDKSYCDMRSLRRHLENHHTSNGISDSRAHGAGSLCSDKPAVVTIERSDSPNCRNLSKLGKSRPVKDKTDQLHTSGYDSGRSSGRSTPGSTHESGVARERPTNLPLEGSSLKPLRERNSDSFSSTASEEVVGNSGEQSVPEKAAEAPKPLLAGDLLKQAADRFKTQHIGQNPSEVWQERFQQQPYMVYHPYGTGTSDQQWYPALYAQNPRFVYQYHPLYPSTVYQMPVTGLVTDPRQRMMSDSDTPNEVTKTVGVSSQSKPSPSHENRPTDTMQLAYLRQNQGGRVTGTPTDPTAVAVATAKEMGHYRYAGESYYGAHPQGTQWQQVRYDETTTAFNSASTMGNSKSSVYSHATTPDSNGLGNSDVESNHLDTVSRGTQFRCAKLDASNEPPEKRPRMLEVSASERNSTNGARHSHIKHEDNNNALEKVDDGLFRNPAEIVSPRRKQRPRPEPLTIPPSASTNYHSNRPTSPVSRSRPCSPPYTPPPMLSPRSIYSIGNLTPRLGAPIQMPMTPNRLQLLSSHSHKSFDLTGDEEVLPFPEPKINVGLEFQAEVPPFVGRKEEAKYDEHKATLVWKPVDEKKRSRREEIESFLEMACSVAVLGGGSNKEYALHILHRANGNVKDAVKLLLCQKHIAQQDDPMHDYHYEGSVRWASKERQVFRQNFRTKGKEFAEIKKDVGEKKTIFDCIEFYYHWKAAYPEAVRGRTRYIDSDSDEDYEDTSSETNSNPSFFECDFPHCNAKFVSRQALNGHIRVHGGSFMKPSEPRRKNRNTTVTNSNGSSPGHVVRKRKSPSPAPSASISDLNNQDGPLPEFACKVCGRIFHKIKSRSAHMKTHVKRPDDDDKMAAKLSASKNH